MKKMASRLGLSFTEKPDRRMLDSLGQSFELFNKGDRRGEFRNFLEGIVDGHHAIVFDYGYVIDAVDTNKSINHTAAIIELKAEELPRFQLGQEDLGKKIKGLVGIHDIKIGHDEEFSRRFWLTGTDSPAIEALFVPEVTGYFRSADMKKAAIESDGGRILYYQVGRVAPEKLQAFLNRTGEVAQLFEKPAEY